MSTKHCWNWQNCQSRQRFECAHTNIWNRCAINQLLNCTHHQKTKVSPGWRAVRTKGTQCKSCPADGTHPQAPSNSSMQHSAPNQLCYPRRLLLLGKHSRAQTKEDSCAVADLLRKQIKGKAPELTQMYVSHFIFSTSAVLWQSWTKASCHQPSRTTAPKRGARATSEAQLPQTPLKLALRKQSSDC